MIIFEFMLCHVETALGAVRQDGAERRPSRRRGLPSVKTARSAVRPKCYRSLQTVTGASQKNREASSPNPNVFEKPNSYSIIPTVTKAKKTIQNPYFYV